MLGKAGGRERHFRDDGANDREVLRISFQMCDRFQRQSSNENSSLQFAMGRDGSIERKVGKIGLRGDGPNRT
jgi:hypothetical protein